MQSVFITGTDTGVGKTALTAALLASARGGGADAVAMKPVQTGVRSGPALVGDLRRIAAAAGWRPAARDLHFLCPYRFPSPCSPHRAAALAGASISIPKIVSDFQKLNSRHDRVYVEGAGGVWVPVGDRETMLDLMVELGLPVLVAARPGLGTLNHTLLTCEALRARRLTVAGVVLVHSTDAAWTPLMRDNLSTLRAFGVPVLGRLPFMPDWPRRPPAAIQAVLRHPALRWLSDSEGL